MHRIDTSTAQVDKFGSGKNGFTGGNPQTGVLPTALDADYFDTLQEELAAVIESAGITLNKAANNQLLLAMRALTPGRLLNVRVFTANTTVTFSAMTKNIRVQIVGGGGGGGGAQATSAGQTSAAGGGGGGAYADAYMPVPDASVALTVGSAGAVGSRTGPTSGSAGGASAFGSYISCPGGTGGPSGSANSANLFYRGMTTGSSPTINLPTGGVLISSMRGQSATGSVILGSSPNQGVGGIGGSSPFGVGGNGGGGTANGTPTAANGYGAGGGGGVEFSSYGGDEGGAGTGGLCIIWEYA
ncbi:glycine-rich domain-containing protein [Pantoea dispersa]|uniref:glycine-rich domain-containing protein n=1 Tax=Pantoea dispersa TaxID=59814 RepID=UPI00241EEE56|nr:hypothetical protein [Pantoea dispersa]